MPIYTVKPGDTLSSIALRHGISSWQKLYDDPSNSNFRAKRPNPNVIAPGEQINVPAVGPIAKYVMAIIDGTGDSNRDRYDVAMQNSFCTQLKRNLGGNAKYLRGPGPLGKEVEDEAKEAYEYLKEAYEDAKKQGPGVRLMLAGYSRGGSAAIMAAELLEKQRIEVDALFLFDAVARHNETGGEVIPANVQFSRHARRDINAYLMVLKYEGTFSDKSWLPNASNPMRPTFGNTGLTWRGNGDHEIATPFRGSHGALGGTGWAFVKEDEECQNRVAAWMNQHLQNRGVNARLKSLGLAEQRRAAIPTASAWISGVALDCLLIAKHEFNLKRAGKVP